MTDKNLKDSPGSPVIPNDWQELRRFTDARIALGRAGTSVPTCETLAFQLDHARARDAVHIPLDSELLIRQVGELSKGFVDGNGPLLLQTQARDRMAYLQRPDLGRRLSNASVEQLKKASKSADSSPVDTPFDLAIVVADGLSSQAIIQNAAPFLAQLAELLQQDTEGTGRTWHCAPLCVVCQGRVAIGDEIGSLLNARAVLVLIGERPGLSSPDSMGLYYTWAPQLHLTDAARNCISNIRPAGLSVAAACHKAFYLLTESRTLKLSGVKLKDRVDDSAIASGPERKNFLLG